MSFKYLNLFKQNEHTDFHYIRKPNGENFLFEIEDYKYIYVGEFLVSFETKDKKLKYSSELGFSDIKNPFAYVEKNTYLMLHREYFPFQEFETSTEKNDYQYLSKEDDEVEGDENEGINKYGNGFKNCKIIHGRD